MENIRQETDVSTRNMIVKLYAQGHTMRKIGEIVGRRHSTIQYIINKYEGKVTNNSGRGRKKILSETDERYILREIKINPKQSVPKLKEEVSKRINRPISVETVRRVLRKENYNGRIARKKPFISHVNKKKRLEFAKKYVNQPLEFWNNVVFTDETKINIFGSDGKQIVWRKPNTELNTKNTIKTIKHGGGSILLWGAMGAGGTGNLCEIVGIMNKNVYLDILKNNLQESIQKLNMPTVYYFQQDNDPKHTAHIVKEWLLYNVPKLLNTPPQSPDINPIENLWKILKDKVQNFNPTNRTEAKKIIFRE